MVETILWVILGCVTVAIIIVWANWQERRAARRYGSLSCPGCGVQFGSDGYATWHTHTRFFWRGRWESGPYMRCKRCVVGFRYTTDGELHPEQFEAEAARRSG
jgi:hypothetical protein